MCIDNSNSNSRSKSSGESNGKSNDKSNGKSNGYDNRNGNSDPDQSAALLALPRLTEKPGVYSGCCLALSTPLVAHLHSLLPPTPALTLSIGSGFGLLEALLVANPYLSHVIGVEVEPSPNRYLPAARHLTVHGSRFLEPHAAAAAAWLFVYPRRVGLLSEYMASHGCDSVQTIVWVGPQADWDDYKPCFSPEWQLHTQSADQVGGKPWELIAVAKRVSV